MDSMFKSAAAFDQNLCSWEIGNTTSVNSMFNLSSCRSQLDPVVSPGALPPAPVEAASLVSPTICHFCGEVLSPDKPVVEPPEISTPPPAPPQPTDKSSAVSTGFTLIYFAVIAISATNLI